MADGDDGTRALELAEKAMAALDVDDAITHLSVAVRAFTAAGDNRQAAMACARLGHVFATAQWNLTAARAWFLRATRLLENEPPCVEQGWVAVAALGCDVDDPETLLANAELALERARQFGDINLETKALADGGLAHVQAGRVAQGMAMLDEAMALASGPADDPDVAGRSVCSFLTACSYAADFDRAGSWSEILSKRGLIGSNPGVQIFLANHCDAVHATLLYELGRWTDAERLLTQATSEFEERMGAPAWHSAIALAELRLRQGRLADAEMLLCGKDGHLLALLPTARLHLARGDFELARATATRGLRAVRHDRLRAVELLAVLVDVALGTGDPATAAARCDEMLERAAELQVPGLAARVAAVRARVLAAGGDAHGAIATLENALDELPSGGAPVLRAALLFDLARLHAAAGDDIAARLEAGRAASTIANLDVVLRSDDAALLARLGIAPTASPAEDIVATAVLARKEGRWTVTCGTTRAVLPDTKGVRYLAELLRNPGVERHVLDLVDQVEGVGSGDGGVDRRRLGDAGAMLDSRARTAYRRRVEDLRAQIDDALAIGSDAKAEALQAELDTLVAELARAFGLGGTERRAASAAERARVNVTRALRTAVARLGEVAPAAGASVDRALRTGLYCAFEPRDTDVRWLVQC